jgi:hypothetical protein
VLIFAIRVNPRKMVQMADAIGDIDRLPDAKKKALGCPG